MTTEPDIGADLDRTIARLNAALGELEQRVSRLLSMVGSVPDGNGAASRPEDGWTLSVPQAAKILGISKTAAR